MDVSEIAWLLGAETRTRPIQPTQLDEAERIRRVLWVGAAVSIAGKPGDRSTAASWANGILDAYDARFGNESDQ